MTHLLVGLRAGRILTRIDLRGHDRLTVGRSPRCDLPLPAANVSRRHALIFRYDGAWHVTDTASRRGIRCPGGWVRHLRFTPDEVASIGPVDLWIEEDPREEPHPFHLGGYADVDVREPDERLEGPILTVVDGAEGTMRRLPLSGMDLLTVGRSPRCDVSLADDSVSRLHCVLYTEHRGWYVADAGSASGTRVHGRRTLRRRVRDDLLVQIGASRLWVEGNRRFEEHSGDTLSSTAHDDDQVLAAALDPDREAPIGRGRRARGFRRGLPAGVANGRK